MSFAVALVVTDLFGPALVIMTSADRSVGVTNASLQAEASRIASSIAADESALQSEGTAYLSLEERYIGLQSETAAARRQIAALEHAATTERDDIQRAAVADYVSAGSGNEMALLLEGAPDNSGIETTYLRAATDDLQTSIALLVSNEVVLRTTLATEQVEATAMSRSLEATAAARSSALETLGSERALLGSVNGRLSKLVLAEAVARARAAELAAAAAAAAARRAAAAAGPPTPAGIVAAVPDPIGSTSLSSAFAAIRSCESGGDYGLDSGNGYYGAYQFSASTWAGLGEAGLASEAPASVQDAAAYRLYEVSRWASWPTCAAISGLG